MSRQQKYINIIIARYLLITINKRFTIVNYSIDCVEFYKKQQHRLRQRDECQNA